MEERERILSLVPDVLREYREQAVQEVMRAATDDFQERATQLFQSYTLDVQRYLRGGGGGTVSSDERHMRKVEGGLNLRDSERGGFRRRVHENYVYLQQGDRGSQPNYASIPMLRTAIESVLSPGRDEVRLTIDPRRRDSSRQGGRERVLNRLVSDYGYCDYCGRDLLRFALRTLQGKEAISMKRGKLSWD